ncbi:MAG: gamma-glutamylcyclotransferase [Candidatus Eremiobacteraeota bacterium]|nr:gamma-glutamylcyclotransferase [Candidatus Eremiobacteraeota bacterium]MCW5867881.1 gamma-glutamylcyclotransferase [Candidatus Eremiobacteraeota bacterium]
MVDMWFTYPPFDEHDFLARVLGRAPELVPGVLRDYQWVRHPAYPHVVPCAGAQVEGSLLPSQMGDEWMWEAEFGVSQGYYRRLQLPVEAGGKSWQAWVLVAGPSLAWAVQGQEDTTCT